MGWTYILDFSSSNKGSFKVSDDGVTYTGTFEISEVAADSSPPFDKYFSDDFTDLDKSNSIWPLQHSQGENGITAKQANGTFTLTGTFTERWFSGDEGEDFDQISERWFYNGQQASLLPLTKDWIVAGESFARSSSPSAAKIAIQLTSEEIVYTEIAIGPSNAPPSTSGSAHWLTQLPGKSLQSQISGVGIPGGGTDGTYRIRHVASEKTFHCEYLDGASWKPIMTFNWHTGAYVHLGEPAVIFNSSTGEFDQMEQSSGQVERWASLEGQYVQPVMLFTVPPGVNVADNQLGFSSFSVTEGAGDGSTPQQVNVAAAASPSSGGTVTGGGQYTHGSTVTLTATPSDGYRFTGWSGDGAGTANPLYITVEADKTVTASFEKEDEPLLPSALANAGTDLGNGWREADWFGFYFPTSTGWHYHAEHGWIYPVGETLDSIWYWDWDLGWCWTSRTVYPYLHRHDPAGWLYYLRESKNPRRFYDYEANAWMPVSESALAYIEAGDSFEKKALYDQALDSYQKALSIALGQYGESHATTAAAYLGIGNVYDSQGQYDLALANFEKSLEIRLKVLGGEHPDVAESYFGIGNVYDSQGQYDLALANFEKSLEIRLKVLGGEHPDVAESYFGIGWAYGEKGQYDLALENFEKSLEIRLKVLGGEHPDTAESYFGIGAVYDSKGQYDLALANFEKSLEIRLKVLGGEHPDTAESYFGIGAEYGSRGQYDLALANFEKSLEIRLKVLGGEHPDTAVSYVGIGVALIYSSTTNKTLALSYFLQSRTILLKTLGADHLYTQQTQGWIDNLQ
jgi:uncharacterized repeat protein (TIGR02543 family)